MDGNTYVQIAQHFSLINLPAPRKVAKLRRTKWHEARIRKIYRRFCIVSDDDEYFDSARQRKAGIMKRQHQKT